MISCKVMADWLSDTLSSAGISSRRSQVVAPHSAVFARVWRGHVELYVLALVDGDADRLVAALAALPDGGAP